MTGDKTSCPRLGSVLRCRLCAVRRPDGETVHVTRFLDARRTATAKDPGFACTASAAPSGRYGLMTPERWGFIPQSRASLVLLVNSIRSACAIGTPTSWVFDDHAAWSASWCVSSLTDCLVESYSTAAELVWMDSALAVHTRVWARCGDLHVFLDGGDQVGQGVEVRRRSASPVSSRNHLSTRFSQEEDGATRRAGSTDLLSWLNLRTSALTATL